MSFKPMLSPHNDPISYPNYFKDLESRYPLIGSPKIDGIRNTVKKACLSRTGKLLPSIQVQNEFSSFEHFDGELIEGCVTDFDVYNRTQSFVMSENKIGDMHYYVFDYTHPDWLKRPFYERIEKLFLIHESLPDKKNVHLVWHENIDNYEELLIFEERCLKMGYEGIMLNNPLAHYKSGPRCTWLQAIIWKLKRFEDGEGIILDIEEGQDNLNEKETDELGYAKRSTHKANCVASGMVGRFKVLFEGQVIDVAPGSFTHDERILILGAKDFYFSKILKFRFFRHGVKDKPRFSRALGFRSTIDM